MVDCSCIDAEGSALLLNPQYVGMVLLACLVLHSKELLMFLVGAEAEHSFRLSLERRLAIAHGMVQLLPSYRAQ